MTAQLAVRDLSGGYGRLAIFRGLDLNLSERRTFGVLGPNGSGKTTLLKTVAGLLPAFAGEVLLEGVALGGKAAYQRTRAGLVLVPEGRQVLVKLSDGTAAGIDEEEGQKRMQQTGKPGDHHAKAERGGREQMAEVALAHRRRMLREELADAHTYMLAPNPGYAVA